MANFEEKGGGSEKYDTKGDGMEVHSRNGQGDGDENSGMKIDKRLNNKRFMRTEKTILRVFFSVKRGLTVKMLAVKTGVSRSTIYRHHKSLAMILPDVERWLIEEFGEEAKEMNLAKRIRVRMMYYRLLVFIHRRRREFEEIIARGDIRTIEQMIDEILPGVGRKYEIGKESAEAIRVYEKEVTAVVETWILEDFSTSEKGVLNDLMYLTRTAGKRLARIGSQGKG